MSLLCATAPVYLTGSNAPAGPVQAASWWSRMFGIGNPPAYQKPAALAGAPSSASAVGAPPTTAPPTTSTSQASGGALPSTPPVPLREVIVVVPDSLFTSFMDQLHAVGLAVERPRQ